MPSPTPLAPPSTPPSYGSRAGSFVGVLLSRLRKISSAPPNSPIPPAQRQLAELIESERQRDTEASLTLAKVSPQTHNLLQRFTKLVTEEQERNAKTFHEIQEKTREVSIASLLRIQRLRGMRRRKQLRDLPLLVVQDEGDDSTPPVREEVLMKQARDLKSWKPRFFQLRSEGLYFWETPESYAADPHTTSALGKILFVDLVLPNGRAADQVPNLVSRILSQQHHVFCAHKESTTYVLGCPNEDSLKGWVKDINRLYDTFLTRHSQRTKLIEAAIGVGSAELYNLGTTMAGSDARAPQVLASLLDSLHDEFFDQVALLCDQRTMRRVLEAWRVLARSAKKRRRRRMGSLGVSERELGASGREL